MDFLGNQTRMNFPGNQMGDGFSWESHGGCNNNNNNNMIRFVPARIESGREEDFLGNLTRMNFPGNQIGDGFSWKSNEDCKKIIIIT